MGPPVDSSTAARRRQALRDACERVLARCYAAADLDAARAAFGDAASLAAENPKAPRALRVLRACSVALVYALQRRRDGAGLLAHLAALERAYEAGERSRGLADVYGHAIAAMARDASCLDDPGRGEVLARADALLDAHPRNGLVLACCADATEALTVGDGDAAAKLARTLRKKLDRAPDDTGLRGRWARAVSLCTDRLRRARRWKEIAPWRDALAAEASDDPRGTLVALDLARATRNVALACADADDLPGLAREVDALLRLRDAAYERRDLRRREFAVEWAWGAKAWVVALGEQSWRWGPTAAEPVDDAAAHLDRAEAVVASMWRSLLRSGMTRAVDLLAEALQDFTWCARVARDDVREARWHERLTRLVRRRPRSAAERYWALSSGSRALTLAERGSLDAALATAEEVRACAARRGDDPGVREALGKALCAEEKARRLRGEAAAADDVVGELEALAAAHPGEAMLTRFFVLTAKARVEAHLAEGAREVAWAWARRVDVLTSRPQGEGLGRRVFAQVLQRLARDEVHGAEEARARLRRLAEENPRDEVVRAAAEPVPGVGLRARG